jgi:23S rRNA (pseudouridine1915-N3)-methyltransferase
VKIIVLAVGKLRSKAVRELCEEYLARLARYGAAEMREVKAAESATAAQSVEQECDRVLAALEPADHALILDERGQQPTSVELSQMLKTHEMRATKRLVCVIGGAYGLNDEVRKRGKNIALSKLTLPHELCRLFLLEQLYRARTIQHGEPYHHA